MPLLQQDRNGHRRHGFWLLDLRTGERQRDWPNANTVGRGEMDLNGQNVLFWHRFRETGFFWGKQSPPDLFKDSKEVSAQDLLYVGIAVATIQKSSNNISQLVFFRKTKHAPRIKSV